MCVARPPTVPLGNSPIQIVPVAVGTWSWGDAAGWEFGKTHTEKDLAEVVTAITAVGSNFLFDTAESYAGGLSEVYLGKLLRESASKAVVATKFSPRRFEIRRKDLFNALRGSLHRLGVKQIDLYQIHWPTRLSFVESRMEALADAVGEGLVRAVGVSNFSRDQILRSHEALARRNVHLATVQVEYSLIHRNPETNGVPDLCRERGITLLAYSPMAMGMLTGKYSLDRLPPAPRLGKYSSEFLFRIQPLLDLMNEIGVQHGQRSPAQVALNWVRAKGALPIAGVKTKQQALEALQAMEWNLNREEIAALDAASDSLLRH